MCALNEVKGMKLNLKNKSKFILEKNLKKGELPLTPS